MHACAFSNTMSPSARPFPCTLIQPASLTCSTPYKARLRLADGSPRVMERKPGHVFWGDPVTHSVENLGETVIHDPIVELKDGGGR
jgi:hypothetical protein